MTDMLEIGRSILASQGFSALLGAELTVMEPGRAELQLALDGRHRQQHGFAHGGVLAYLADNAMTYAGGTVLQPILTLEMKINYVRPAIGDRLIARASVLSSGRTTAVCECKVYAVQDGAEKLVAVAQGTVAVAAGRSPD